MKNFNDSSGNRTRDLPACSAVPQQTAPPRTPFYTCGGKNFGTPDTVWCSAGGSLGPPHWFAENAALEIMTEVQRKYVHSAC